jgi:hypothetical protein
MACHYDDEAEINFDIAQGLSLSSREVSVEDLALEIKKKGVSCVIVRVSKTLI